MADDPRFRRTLRLLVSVASELAFPKKRLVGGHPAEEGYLYQLEDPELQTEEAMRKIEKQVRELHKDKIERVKLPWSEVVSYAEENNLSSMKALLETRVLPEVNCYTCRGVRRLALHPVYEDFCPLQADTVKTFRFEFIGPGFGISYAEKRAWPCPEYQRALREMHRDHIGFGRNNEVTSVGELNKLQQVGRGRKDYVLKCEFRQEGKLAQIAQQCKERKASGKQVKLIAIAGPTSSGKTTFANKLCMYLLNAGFPAKPLTVDHYYLPLDRQPKYQARKNRSDVDYDHIESMDVELVGQHLKDLADGKSVMTPVYDMKTGYRDGEGKLFPALPEDGILVIEGIHALNPLYTEAVEASKVFKIFISPLTALQLDDCNVVKSTDHRLLRRMCRDYLFRGHSASKTLMMWDNVRKGEGVWIFPHQNNADFVMNSAADYEIPVLKTFIEPLLKAVTPDDPNYKKAAEVLELLSHFNCWPPELTPSTALLREFIGDGAYDCH